MCMTVHPNRVFQPSKDGVRTIEVFAMGCLKRQLFTLASVILGPFVYD